MTAPSPKVEQRLLPCPFCGASAEELGLNRPTDHRTGPHAADWFIRCYVCHVETSEYPTEAEVVAAWNRRNLLTPSGDVEGRINPKSLARIIDRMERAYQDAINETAYALSFEGPTCRRADQARKRANDAQQKAMRAADDLRAKLRLEPGNVR